MLAPLLALSGWSWILCLLAAQGALPLSPGPQSGGAAPTSAPALEQAWALSFGELRRAPLLPLMPLGELVLVADERGGLSALQAETGTLRWFVQLSGPLDTVPVAGRFLALTSGATTLVVEARSGARIGSFTSAEVATQAAASDGRLLYLPSVLDHTLLTVDLASGQTVWRFTFPERFVTPVLLGQREGGRVAVVGCANGRLYGLPAEGAPPRREQWSHVTGALAGAPLWHDGDLLVAGRDGVLWKLQAAGGGVVWKQSLGASLTAAPLLAGGTLVASTRDGLVACSAETGAVLWRAQGAESALTAGEHRIIARTGARLVARAVDDGRLLADPAPPGLTGVGAMWIERRPRGLLVGWHDPLR